MSQELKMVQRDFTPATVGEIESHFAELAKQGWTLHTASVLAMTWSDSSQTALNGFKVAFFLVRDLECKCDAPVEAKRGRGRPPKVVLPVDPV